MKALILPKPGSLDLLKVQDLEKPVPQSGEILVRVHAAGINPVDYKLAKAGHPSWSYPFVLGLDVAGTVEAVGEGVKDFNTNDRVVYHGDLTKPGGFAQHAVTTAHTTSKIPQGLSFAQAAAFPCAGLTAYQAVHRKIDMRFMHSILIHAGAGGVGGYAIQLARRAGLKVYTTCSPQNFSWVQKLGADAAIDYNAENVSQRIETLTDGRGVDAVINTLGPEQASEDWDRLAFGGHLVCIGGLPDLSKINLKDEALSVHAIALGKAHAAGDRMAREDLARMAEAFALLLADGSLESMVTQEIGLEGIPDALKALEKRHVRGKIVARMV